MHNHADVKHLPSYPRLVPSKTFTLCVCIRLFHENKQWTQRFGDKQLAMHDSIAAANWRNTCYKGTSIELQLRLAMKKNHLSKLVLAVAATGLLLATSSFAQTFTYSFTGSNGYSTDLNGTTITIQDNAGIYTVTAFDFIDTGESGSPFTSNTGTETTVITSATTSGWVGIFEADGLGGTDLAGLDTSDGLQDNLSEVNVSGLSTDAPGNWSYVNSTAPDASSTFVLLLGAFAATALGTRGLRRQPATFRH